MKQNNLGWPWHQKKYIKSRKYFVMAIFHFWLQPKFIYLRIYKSMKKFTFTFYTFLTCWSEIGNSPDDDWNGRVKSWQKHPQTNIQDNDNRTWTYTTDTVKSPSENLYVFWLEYWAAVNKHFPKYIYDQAVGFDGVAFLLECTFLFKISHNTCITL